MRYAKWIGLGVFSLVFCWIAFVYHHMWNQISQPSQNSQDQVGISRFARLHACAEGHDAPPGMAYFCRKILLEEEFEHSEILQISGKGTFGILEYSDDKKLAETILKRLVSEGLNINAVGSGDEAAFKNGWTALHAASYSLGSSADSEWWIKLLLQVGARSDIRDATGRTPVQLAEASLSRHPGDENSRKIVELLRANSLNK
jgi:hypothetical protein